MRLLAPAIGLLLALTACGGGGDDAKVAPTETVTVTETVEVATPTSDPTEAATPTDDASAFEPNVGSRALRVGRPRVGSVTTTTLLEVRDPYPSAGYREPDKGNRFVGLRISQCTQEDYDTSEGDIVSTYEGEWVAVTRDNDEYPSTGSSYVDFPTPRFPDSITIPPGSCVKGWLAVQLPAELKYEKFVWRSEGSTIAEWLTR